MARTNLRQLWLILSNLLRYPRLRGKLGDLEPNVYYGTTDHPLDVGGTPVGTMFTALWKLSRRRAASVLRVELRKRRRNSFIFTAKVYDVVRLRDFEEVFEHRYKVKDSTRHGLCTLRLDLLREQVYRLRLARGDEVPDSATPMIVNDIRDEALQVDLKEERDAYRISTKKLCLVIYKHDFRIEIFDREGNLLTESGGKTKNEFCHTLDVFPLGFVKDRNSKRTYAVDSFVLYPQEAIYGLGEQFGPLNKVGQTLGLWHWEGAGNTSGRTYKNIPFFMSTQGYGVFVNSTHPITFWVGSKEHCKNQFAVEGETLDYFFFGGSFKEILYQYTALTGRAPMPPKYSFGTWMSRASYRSQAEVMEVARKLRELRFPCDVIHIDTTWFKEEWRCDWEFGSPDFPDPEKMFRELREMGFRVSLWQTPYVMDETEAYREAKSRGLLAKNNAPFVFIGKFPAHPIDFSKPEAVRWYKEKLAKLFARGAAVIKTDFGEGIEPAMQFKGGSGRAMHNVYPLLYNKAAFEISEQIFGEGLVWARSAWAGSQRYPVHWSGDNSANFENLLCSLRGGLSLGLSGFSFWSQDTGGFVGTPGDELYVRWVQLSIFQSHIRFHGVTPREPWHFGLQAQAIARKFLELRYQLFPYLYSEAVVAARSGLPMLAPLVLEFQDDPTAWHVEDQFLCGRNLLIAPILTRGNQRRIYLPKGDWYEYTSGEKLSGPCWIERRVPLDEIPVFVRAGTILPLAPVAQCTDELSEDELFLKVFADRNGKASYELNHAASSGNARSTSISVEIIDGSPRVKMNPEVPKVHVSCRVW